MSLRLRSFSAVMLVSAGIGMGLFATPLTARAIGFLPFGGVITAIAPCLGAGLYHATIKQPLWPPITVLALPTPFLFYSMSHPGQFTLGLLGPPTFCATAPHQGFMAPTSFFYGTSL